MRKIFLFLFIFTKIFVFAQVNPNYHKVNGYYRSNGTYVEPHYRTNRNNTNTDNYTTRPNTNPWTGKPGTISPDNNNNTYPTNSYNPTNNSYSNTQKNYLNSSISLYTNYGESGYLKIWIDGNYVGSLYSHFKNGVPICGQNGTIKVPLTSGTHTYRAEDNAGFYWTGNFTTSQNECSTLGFNTSSESRFDLGMKKAKETYQTAYLNYVIPFTVTAFDLKMGAATTLTIDLFPPSIYKSGDQNYDKGYRRVARKKKILATVISFGLGALTNLAINN
ncbi:hypothetical protein [Flavobacterium columnare]|uniref:hypothetical protein n=1 Tax=Flavobacterium columnare TaxID=996 RepID=UPI000D19CD99|nr:hypothetical protein [Flavobacterium columnare]PTD15039.1 hypothetical protein C6N29_11710 [Flavobacterium columnare]